SDMGGRLQRRTQVHNGVPGLGRPRHPGLHSSLRLLRSGVSHLVPGGYCRPVQDHELGHDTLLAIQWGRAFFHHFPTKAEFGYSVVEEILAAMIAAYSAAIHAVRGGSLVCRRGARLVRPEATTQERSLYVGRLS